MFGIRSEDKFRESGSKHQRMNQATCPRRRQNHNTSFDTDKYNVETNYNLVDGEGKRNIKKMAHNKDIKVLVKLEFIRRREIRVEHTVAVNR